MRKTIFLLLGKKGSGKTFIGELFEKHFHIRFLRVEDWAIEVKGRRNPDDEAYIEEVFTEIEKGVRKALEMTDMVGFESTGLGLHFDKMYRSLQSSYRVITIGVHAGSELCLSRVRTRDQHNHIDVSDDQVNRINEAVEARKFTCAYNIENSRTSEKELTAIINRIIRLAGDLHQRNSRL